MSRTWKYIGSAVVASMLAVALTLYVFQLTPGDAINTGLIAGVVALVIVYLNDRNRAAATELPHEKS